MAEYDFVECQGCGKAYRVTRGSMRYRSAICPNCLRKVRYPDDVIGDAPRNSRTKILRM